MFEGLDALTEKEKDTLRLIACGHDAKSAARELDLSVHTINERLRAARRKLNVTSSREAARVLLENDIPAPENPVYKEMGDANAASVADLTPIKQPSRNAAFWIGGISMSLITATIALALSNPDLIASRDTETPSTEIALADVERERAARTWLALVDKGDWQGSFDAAGRAFRAPNTVATWQAAAEQARGPLGAVISREVIGLQTVAVPPRGYQVVRFHTDFADRDGVIESVTLERENDVLRVVGYFIT